MEFISRSSQNLGSVFEIKVPKENEAVCEECFKELARIEAEYSRFIKTSKISVLNSNLNQWYEVSDEFIFLLHQALEFNKKTDGYFDITIKSTLDRLGYDSEYSFVKKEEKKEGFFEKIVTKFRENVQIDTKNKKVLLRKEIEIGGFGKGYCLDRLSNIMNNANIENYLINAGGDIKTKSSGFSPANWVVLLEHPDDLTRAIGKISLNNKAFAASAPNRRRWGKEMKEHHLINAKTKQPENSVKCIFVIADTGIEADAYSTALFTAGFEEGIRLSLSLPVEIVIVSDKGKMYMSGGFGAEIFDKDD